MDTGKPSKISALSTVGSKPRQACPKPTRRVQDKHVKRTSLAKQALAFRLAVWKRDGSQCRICLRQVVRSLELLPNRGEVHHLMTRGAHPEQRFDVANGVLLCAVCHGKLQRHEIKWKGTR